MTLNSRRILSMLAVSLLLSFETEALALPQLEPIKGLGTYSNVVHTKGGEDEHASGFTVSLWQRPDQEMVGIFTSQYGLADIKPCGLLNHVKFGQHTKTLKFDCKMSTGSVHVKSKDMASKELFKFSGVLGASILRGRLTKIDVMFPKQKPKVINVVLRKTEGIDASQIKVKTFLAWKAQSVEQMKMYGAKW